MAKNVPAKLVPHLQVHTVRKVLADFTVSKALCDKKVSQLEENGGNFRHIRAKSHKYNFLTVCTCQITYCTHFEIKQFCVRCMGCL